MDFLKSHTFISLFIAGLYFIIKTLLNKLQKDKDIRENTRKTLFKDSVMIFVICYLSFVFRTQVISFQETETQVFTNEPSF